MSSELTDVRLAEMRERFEPSCTCEMFDGEECDECRPWQTLCALMEDRNLLKGAMAADDERLARAAASVGVEHMGCDAAEWMADEVLGMRKIVAELEAKVIRQRGVLAAAAGSPPPGYCVGDLVDWLDDAHAEVARLRGGPEGPWSACRDCGRAMVWSRDAGVWMCPRHTHERMATAERLLRERDAEVERLRRYEALGAAWLAHDAANAAYWAHVEKRPPLAVPDSPEQRAWEKERLRLEAVASDTLDAKDTAGAALAAESEGKR